MQFLSAQPTYSLHNNQERIKLFQNNRLEDNIDSSSSSETLQSVLERTFFTKEISNAINKSFINNSENIVSSIDKSQFNQYCSSLAKRLESYSLSNHSTMAITALASFSEEQTNSLDYDNTYLYAEEISRLDDFSSFTTVTSNLTKTLNTIEQDTSVCSDTTIFHSDADDISESISFNIQQYQNNNENPPVLKVNTNIVNEAIMPIYINLTPNDFNFTGLAYATKCTIIKPQEKDDEQTLSAYDNVAYYSEQNNKIRSHVDVTSLISSMTSSMQDNHCPMTFTGEQLNKQETKRTNGQDGEEEEDDYDDDDYFIVDQQKAIDQLTMMNNESETEVEEEYDHDDEHFESTRLFDTGQHDGMLSDESQYSDDLRYSLDAIRNSSVNDDDLNNTSSTLRQEAISITKVRCKQRENWIRSSATYDQVDGTITSPAFINANVNFTTRAQTGTTMLLHKNSVDCNKNENKNSESVSYEFLQLNNDHHLTKADKSIVPPLLKTTNTYDKDAPSTSQKTNSFYLIHHQSSLVPIQDLLNKKLNKNIEIIQMDEQECILEIVDGVLKLVPRDKSTSSTANSYGEKSEEQRKTSSDYEKSNNYNSPKKEERSSSITSSISTPSLSENEQDDEHDDDEQQQEKEHDHKHEHESEHEQEHDEITSSSRLSWNKEESQGPFILLRDVRLKSPPLPSQSEQSGDLLDLFSTPLVALSNSNTNNNNDKNTKNLLDDSLSSVSSYENHNNNSNSSSDSIEGKKIRSTSPIQHQSIHSSSASSTSSKDEIPPVSSPTKNSVLTEIVQTIEKLPTNDEAEVDYQLPKTEVDNQLPKTEVDYQLPKTEPPPAAKPINKARINEFASLLSSAVHLTQPPATKKQEPSKTIATVNQPLPSPSRSEDQSFSSIPSANSDREERESFHTVKSNNNSEQEQIKKHIDARYNEKIDDRASIQINTSNIKALFEQKISDTNKTLTQSSEHLLHVTEARQQQQQQQHKKVPISYGSLKRNIPISPQQTTSTANRRPSYQDFSSMNKYSEHVVGTKDVVIEDKQPEHVHQTQPYGSKMRRSNTDQITRSGADSLASSPVIIPNGYYSETLIAREIRETKEKEEELKRQRKKCGLAEDLSSLSTVSKNDLNKPDSSTVAKQSVKNSSFLSNLDFFTSKAHNSPNELTSPRRSTVALHNVVYDSHGTSPNDERKPMSNVVSQELNRFNNNGVPIIRTSSTNNLIHRSASNQNMVSAQTTNNIIQREIEAIRAKEAELRESGRIQHTSDDHSDPRKYQELVSVLPKSQSTNMLSTQKVRRDSGRMNGPLTSVSNGSLKTKPIATSSSVSSIRGKFPSPNPTAPIISASNKSTDYSKLSSSDRLELEKRECQEREQELRKQRHSVSGASSSVNPTVNSGSGNVLQDERGEDKEHYFDKIERLKKNENDKAQAPLVRPGKKLDMSQRWEQMMANKNFQNTTGDNDD
ncbi:unnamed protein product [Rotaria magnacalcarata]